MGSKVTVYKNGGRPPPFPLPFLLRIRSDGLELRLVGTFFRFADVQPEECLSKLEKGPKRVETSMKCVHNFDQPEYCTCLYPNKLMLNDIVWVLKRSSHY